MTIAITGATGQLGRLVASKLKEQVPAFDVVALVRSPAKAADLGVTAREADYDRPETLDRALAGVDTLLLISGPAPGVRVAQHRNVIEAAKRSGVKRIVYTSALHADTSTLDIAPDHRATEADLKASGIPFTILRNGWYTENYTASIPGALAGGAFLGSAGDARISSATRADYAEAAAAVLTGAGHEGRTYELAGDEAWTFSDLAAEISRQTGRTIPYTNLPAAEYAKVLVSVGLPGRLAQAIAGWDVAAAQGALFDDSRQLSALIGRPTTPLAVAVAGAFEQVAPPSDRLPRRRARPPGRAPAPAPGAPRRRSRPRSGAAPACAARRGASRSAAGGAPPARPRCARAAGCGRAARSAATPRRGHPPTPRARGRPAPPRRGATPRAARRAPP